MRARALKKGQPTEGTRWGHWCFLELAVSCSIYSNSLKNIFVNSSVISEHLTMETWTWFCPVAGLR